MKKKDGNVLIESPTSYPIAPPMGTACENAELVLLLYVIHSQI